MSKSKKAAPDAAVTAIATAPVPTVLSLLEERLASLKHIETTAFKAGENLVGFGNIRTETNVKSLIKAWSSIKGRSKAYDDAAPELGLDNYPVFDVDGYSPEAWKHDIMLRIAILNHKETYDKLNSFKSQMSAFLSEEDRKSILMKEMAEYLGKI
jgi:hypothetical protein